MINKETIEQFEYIFNYPLRDFLLSYQKFLEDNYNKIKQFYSGEVKNADGESFYVLDKLKNELSYIYSIIPMNNNMLTNFVWWDFMTFLEEVDNTLSKIGVMQKWLRSSITNSTYELNPEIELSLKQGQTLETFARVVLGDRDWDNNWTEIALKNDMTEEDYTSDGGNIIKVSFRNGSQVFKIQSVVDTISHDTILGKDIDKKIQFEDDDLVVLSSTDTFIQSVEILVQSKKSSVPEYPFLGIQENLFVGANINSIVYPSLVRQLSELLKTDDTVKSFTIKSIRRESDAVYVDFEIESRRSDLVVSSMPMS